MGRNRGFSLTEIMVVVAILAVLACIAYPVYTGYLDGGKRSEAATNLEQIRLLAEERFALNGAYGADGLYNGVAAVQGLLPDWEPPNNLIYDYYIQVSNAGQDFLAGAVPGANAPGDAAIGGAPVANTVATIDDNNQRQGANFW